jgi:hypothetical protein
MGHSSIQVTLDLYGHLTPGAESEAASRLDALLASAENTARSADSTESTGTHTGTQPTPLAFSDEISPQTGTRRGAGVVERGGLENAGFGETLYIWEGHGRDSVRRISYPRLGP